MEPGTYLCLRCTRENLSDIDLDSVTFGTVPDDVFATCSQCGGVLPESKKRELKAENLILRAQVHELRRQLHEAKYEAQQSDLEWRHICQDYIEFGAKAEVIAENAIENAHLHYRMEWHWRKAYFRLLKEGVSLAY